MPARPLSRLGPGATVLRVAALSTAMRVPVKSGTLRSTTLRESWTSRFRWRRVHLPGTAPGGYIQGGRGRSGAGVPEILGASSGRPQQHGPDRPMAPERLDPALVARPRDHGTVRRRSGSDRATRCRRTTPCRNRHAPSLMTRGAGGRPVPRAIDRPAWSDAERHPAMTPCTGCRRSARGRSPPSPGTCAPSVASGAC